MSKYMEVVATEDLIDDISTAVEAQALATKQDKLTAGSNITLNGNTISATNTTYTAGDGIDIIGDAISTVPEEVILEGSTDWLTPGTYTISSATEVEKLETLESYIVNGREPSLKFILFGANAVVNITHFETDSAFFWLNGLWYTDYNSIGVIGIKILRETESNVDTWTITTEECDTTYSDFVGTDGTSAGTEGLVPAPTASDANKYLKSDGTWATVSGGGGSYVAGNNISISGNTISVTGILENQHEVTLTDYDTSGYYEVVNLNEMGWAEEEDCAVLVWENDDMDRTAEVTFYVTGANTTSGSALCFTTDDTDQLQVMHIANGDYQREEVTTTVSPMGRVYFNFNQTDAYPPEVTMVVVDGALSNYVKNDTYDPDTGTLKWQRAYSNINLIGTMQAESVVATGSSEARAIKTSTCNVGGHQGTVAIGNSTTASGYYSFAEGDSTKASRKSQHVEGKYNIEESGSQSSEGIYLHIAGNGSSNTRSNAYTLDWSGNGWFSGDVYVGSTSGTNKDAGSKKLATQDYVDTAIGSAMSASY